MFELGFHFSLYGERGEYKLSIPYQIAITSAATRSASCNELRPAHKTLGSYAAAEAKIECLRCRRAL